jgi:hypothetical protein
METLVDFDGVVGWGGLRRNIWVIRCNEKRLSIMTELPKDFDARQWTKYDLLKDAPYLAFRPARGEGQNMAVIIDTGHGGGITLSPENWKKWRQEHANRPATLEAVWMPASGMTVNEVCWADELTLGSFSLKDVPVSQDSLLGKGIDKDYQAAIGLFALTRMDVITDWRNGSLYVRPTKDVQWNYDYNRIGAVFVPVGNKGKDLVGHVAGASPAYKAGIRDGDVLLRIDDLDVTKWQTDPTVLPLHRFWSRPAGTKIRLALRRDGKQFETTVETRDILQQESKARGASGPTTSPTSDAGRGPASRPVKSPGWLDLFGAPPLSVTPPDVPSGARYEDPRRHRLRDQTH